MNQYFISKYIIRLCQDYLLKLYITQQLMGNQCCETVHDKRSEQVVEQNKSLRIKPFDKKAKNELTLQTSFNIKANNQTPQLSQRNKNEYTKLLEQHDINKSNMISEIKNSKIASQQKQKSFIKDQKSSLLKNENQEVNSIEKSTIEKKLEKIQISENEQSKNKKQLQEKEEKDLRKSVRQNQEQNQTFQPPPISVRRSSKMIIQPPKSTSRIEASKPQLHQKIKQVYQNLGPLVVTIDRSIPIQQPHQLIQNNHIYEGQWKNKKPDGYGKLYLPNGCFFQGTFVDGSIQGLGRMIYPDGGYFEGLILKNQATGKGKYYSQTLEYEGEFLNNQFHGYGIEKASDGSTFKGEYRNGHKYKGILTWQKNEYDGLLNEKGSFDKQGKLITPQGQYIGEFKDGLKHGFGQYKKKGTVYKGNYVEGAKCGFGTFYNADGSIAYKGLWKNNLPNGLGCVYKNGVQKPDREWVDGLAKQQIQKAQGSNTH